MDMEHSPSSQLESRRGQTPTAAPTQSRSSGSDSRQLGAGEEALELFKQYARQRPETVALWAFGAGFLLGWKLRIW